MLVIVLDQLDSVRKWQIWLSESLPTPRSLLTVTLSYAVVRSPGRTAPRQRAVATMPSIVDTQFHTMVISGLGAVRGRKSSDELLPCLVQRSP
jgi:hypothetical protein